MSVSLYFSNNIVMITILVYHIVYCCLHSYYVLFSDSPIFLFSSLIFSLCFRFSSCSLWICALNTSFAFSKHNTLIFSWFSLTFLASRLFFAAMLFLCLFSLYFACFEISKLESAGNVFTESRSSSSFLLKVLLFAGWQSTDLLQWASSSSQANKRRSSLFEFVTRCCSVGVVFSGWW